MKRVNLWAPRDMLCCNVKHPVHEDLGLTAAQNLPEQGKAYIVIHNVEDSSRLLQSSDKRLADKSRLLPVYQRTYVIKEGKHPHGRRMTTNRPTWGPEIRSAASGRQSLMSCGIC